MPGKKVVRLLFWGGGGVVFFLIYCTAEKKALYLAACCFEEDVILTYSLSFCRLPTCGLYMGGFLPGCYSQVLISRRAITGFWVFCLLHPPPPSPVLPLIHVDNSNFNFNILE